MEVIGSGMLASVFRNSETKRNIKLFCSGVSNSLETRYGEFHREEALLSNNMSQVDTLVYFSTCSIYEETGVQSPYTSHKKKMENIVLSSPRNYVFRLPQVIGRSRNKTTLINFLAKNILTGKVYPLYHNVRRNLIDVEDVRSLTLHVINQGLPPGIHNCAMPKSHTVSEIVKILEDLIGLPSQHIEKGGQKNSFPESKLVADAVAIGVVEYSCDYLERTLEKYYSNFRNWYGSIK